MIAASGHTTMSVADATVTNGETTTVAVTLSGAPDGVAGFNVTVEVADPGAATITGAAVDSGMSPSNASIASDGGSVQLRGADLSKNVQAGDGPFTIANVSLRGDAVGQTALSVVVDQVDDDDGTGIDPTVDDGRVTVTTADDETPTDTPTETETEDSGTGGDTGGNDPGSDDPSSDDDGSTGGGGVPPAGVDGNDGGSGGDDGGSSGGEQSGDTTTETTTATATQTATESSTPTDTATPTVAPTPTSVTTQEPTPTAVTTQEQTATDTASTTVSSGPTAMENEIDGGAEAPTAGTNDGGGFPLWFGAVVVVGAGAGVYWWRQQP